MISVAAVCIHGCRQGGATSVIVATRHRILLRRHRRHRRRRSGGGPPFVFLCLLLLLLQCSNMGFASADDADNAANEEAQEASDTAAAAEDEDTRTWNVPGGRVFTAAELALGNGVDSENLYLAIIGKVYDVSAGAEYYGPEGPYHVFVGRDAPVPFVSGVFTDEEAAKPWDSLEVKQHGGLLSWIDFYRDEEKYPLVGVVEGNFYDGQGQPLPELKRVTEAMSLALQEQKRREAERQQKLAERKKKQQQQQQMMTEL